MLTKLNNFFGQALLAFLPALLVAFISHFDISLSGHFSFSFALVGVCFSIFYMGQRAYIAINGVVDNSFHNELVFRDINMIFACVMTLILSLYLELPLWLSLCAMTIKLSESPIELHNGIELKYRGANKAAKNLCVASFIRALFIIAPFLIINPVEISSFKIYTLYYLLFGIIVWLLFKRKIKLLSLKGFQVKLSYFANFNRLKVFAFATIACSILSALPRLLTSPAGVENSLILIALSISPAIAVVFQAIWLANIEKLNTKKVGGLLLFYVEIFAVLFIVILTSPIWSMLIPIVYGISATDDIDIFKNIIIVMSLFFSAMTLMNCFKFYKPKLETVAYISSSLTLLITSYLNIEILNSLIWASTSMCIFAFIPLISHLKKELN